MRRSSASSHPLAEEAQQRAIVRRRGRDEEMVDRRRAEPPLQLRRAKLRAARDVVAPEVDEAALAALHVDDAHESAIGKAILARITDRDRDDVMPPVEL